MILESSFPSGRRNLVFGVRQGVVKGNGFTKENLKARNMGLVFAISILLSLVMALNLALFVGDAGLEFGLIAGFLAGSGWVVPAFGIVALFEKRPLAYLLVNGGYMVVAFILMGAIVGGWRQTIDVFIEKGGASDHRFNLTQCPVKIPDYSFPQESRQETFPVTRMSGPARTWP